MLELHVLFDKGEISKMLRRCGASDNGEMQLAVDNAVVRYLHDYWAFDTGLLAESVEGQGTGLLTYFQPYAHYQWMGEVYGPNIPVFEDDSGIPTRFFSPPGQPKHPTGRAIQYKTDKNPLAGAFPLERMKADHMDDILEEARRVATGAD